MCFWEQERGYDLIYSSDNDLSFLAVDADRRSDGWICGHNFESV